MSLSFEKPVDLESVIAVFGYFGEHAPVPETRPTNIEGWMLREVTNGTAVLEGQMVLEPLSAETRC